MNNNEDNRQRKFDLNDNSHYARRFPARTAERSGAPHYQNARRESHRRHQSSRSAAPRQLQRRPGAEQSEARLFDGDEVSQGIDFDRYEAIPVEISGRDAPPCIERFDEIDNVHPQLIWNIRRSGYTRPTPVQKHAISIAVAGRDIMAVAQTGSGKTAAYLLPMVQMLLETGGADSTHRRSYDVHQPIGVVLAPTRELALQVHSQASKFLFRTGMRAVAVYGGVSIGLQRRELRAGVDIVVATPGRLTDFLKRGEMELSRVRFLVLDEADRMLDMGFEEQIREILHADFGMPPEGQRQTLLFSATFPPSIQQLAARFMGDYIFVAVGKVGGACESVQQELVYAETADKASVLLDFFANVGDDSVLIFVERKLTAGRIENFLRNNGIRAMSIHGDKNQSEREYSMRSFKSGVCKVLVATDVASRGLDIPNVNYVVNYDMSNNIDDYIHRIGRTGRIGNKGVALTIISERENVNILEDLQETMKDSDDNVPDWMEALILRKMRQKNSMRPSYGRGNRSRRGRGRGRRGGFG